MKSLLAASAIVIAGACYLAAQQPNTDQQTQQPATSQVVPGPTAPDRQNRPDQMNQDRVSQGRHDLNFYIIDCLVDGNRAEITLARLAEQRATDPEVKQFAQRAMQDHTQFLNKLQQAQGNSAGRQSNDQSATGANPSGESQSQANPSQTGVTPTSGQADQTNGANTNAAANQVARQHVAGQHVAGQHMDQRGGARQFVQLEKQIRAQCLQSMTQELSQKEGARFDKCYMNGMVAAHMAMADHLAVFSRSADDNLRTLCQEGLQTTQQHLQMARQIANRLDGNTAAPSSANSNTNSNPQQQ